VRLADFFGLLGRGDDLAPATSRVARRTLELCRELVSERGEVSTARLAGEALTAFQSLDAPARRVFFDLLAVEFSPEPEAVETAAAAYSEEPSPANLVRLQHVVEPLRRELFRRLNLAPGGTAALVEMRGKLLADLPDHPHWEPISADLLYLFAAWFNRGFLTLKRIDWRSSALILEKVIRYEAVHEIQDWNDMRRRVAADRRCYAFFHPALADEPIIFIEVALTRGISDKVQPLLDPASPVLDPETADSAVFYSITNCQEGLRGVPLGSFLIKRVVEDLSAAFPRLRNFSTLSPIPGFRPWLEQNLSALAKDPRYASLAEALDRLDQPGWWKHPRPDGELERLLSALCAFYLLHAKQQSEPLDPVARFHLRNGARLERINWLGDTSAAGRQRSAGLMANYLYRLNDVERNHELYAREYRIAATYKLEALARKAAPQAASGNHRISRL
jgi:malonyl-CoA decarboxylase